MKHERQTSRLNSDCRASECVLEKAFQSCFLGNVLSGESSFLELLGNFFVLSKENGISLDGGKLHGDA
jgi:hypothetical protein